MQANNQIIIKVNDISFFLNPRKKHFINDIGIIAVNENNNKASIVLLESINSIIIDSRIFFLKS